MFWNLMHNHIMIMLSSVLMRLRVNSRFPFQVAASQPGALPGRIAAALPADAQQQLQSLVQSAGVAIS